MILFSFFVYCEEEARGERSRQHLNSWVNSEKYRRAPNAQNGFCECSTAAVMFSFPISISKLDEHTFTTSDSVQKIKKRELFNA